MNNKFCPNCGYELEFKDSNFCPKCSYNLNDNNFINGEYIIDRISIPIAYNGLMNITANKAIERILY